jgi:probable phosphoglycerate mutase
MKLLAARHGETAWNLEGREMGHLDSPLTERGLEQAEALARRLAELRIELVYSSDLGRAKRTGEVIAATCQVELRVDPALRERNMGIFQGLTKTEMLERYPVERKAYEMGGFDYVIPEGESARQRTERSVRALTEIAERHEPGRVAVVTHAGFLLGFVEHVLGVEPGESWRFRRHNGSLSIFEHDDARWRLETWNDTSHLLHLGFALGYRTFTARDLDDLRALIAESEAEGFQFLRRVAHELAFPGTTMIGAYDTERLVAIGGVTPDPYATDRSVGRVRHVYVHPAYRRRGVGRRLIALIEEAAVGAFARLRLRTDSSDAAAFYEALGYERSSSESATHARDLT